MVWHEAALPMSCYIVRALVRQHLEINE